MGRERERISESLIDFNRFSIIIQLARVQCLPHSPRGKMQQRRPDEGGLPRARLKVGYKMSDGTLVACVYRDTSG